MLFRGLRLWLWRQDLYLWSTCPWCGSKLKHEGYEWMVCPNKCGWKK